MLRATANLRLELLAHPHFSFSADPAARDNFVVPRSSISKSGLRRYSFGKPFGDNSIKFRGECDFIIVGF